MSFFFRRRSSKSAPKEDFDEEARKLFEQLNLGPDGSGAGEGGPSRFYSTADRIWVHPTGGGTVYVGNQTAARDKAWLESHGIKHIVNCQESDAPNYHEHDDSFTYKRFQISHWYSDLPTRSGKGVLAYFDKVVRWIVDVTAEGGSVLIHCLAGAHRAGTTGTAFLMCVTDFDRETALKAARACRPIIDPIGSLGELLKHLAKAHAQWPDTSGPKRVEDGWPPLDVILDASASVEAAAAKPATDDSGGGGGAESGASAGAGSGSGSDATGSAAGAGAPKASTSEGKAGDSEAT